LPGGREEEGKTREEEGKTREREVGSIGTTLLQVGDIMGTGWKLDDERETVENSSMGKRSDWGEQLEVMSQLDQR
jgi:hypothetical protein